MLASLLSDMYRSDVDVYCSVKAKGLVIQKLWRQDKVLTEIVQQQQQQKKPATKSVSGVESRSNVAATAKVDVKVLTDDIQVPEVAELPEFDWDSRVEGSQADRYIPYLESLLHLNSN